MSQKCGIKFFNPVFGRIHVISRITVIFFILPLTVSATVTRQILKLLGIYCGYSL